MPSPIAPDERTCTLYNYEMFIFIWVMPTQTSFGYSNYYLFEHD